MTLPAELIVMGLSALPIVELRGAIPLAIGVYGFPWQSALAWSLVGNIGVAVVLVVFLDRLFQWSSHRWYRLNRLLAWAYNRAHRKHSDRIEHLEGFALFLLVAIPLPFTGAWTGAIVATVAGFGARRALVPIILGVMVAGVVVTLITAGGLSVSSRVGSFALLLQSVLGLTTVHP